VKRAPFVIAGTVAGLIGVLEFHTTPASVAIPGTSALPATSAGSANGAGGASSPGAGTSPAAGQGQGTSPSPSAGSSKTVSRTAVGPGVNYSYGVVAVRVTATGGKIVKIGIASLQDDGDPRSQLIDEQALPILEREALQAQSANIQGVSGASYTTAGFVRSLQAALQTLDK
jgi:uncharacterized protein with FMN-binding domain